MRIQHLLFLLCACGGAKGDAAQPTAEPIGPTVTSEPTASATASPSSTAAAVEGKPQQKADEEDSWTVETGSAKGITLNNDAGGELKLKTLGWTSFLRKTKPIGSKTMPNANVSFATVSADDAVASDVVCTLPEWPDFPKDPATLAATMVPLVAKDAVPTAALLKAKSALLACSGGKQLRLEWEFKESKLVTVEFEGADAKTTTCVKNAVAKAFMFESGVCAATLAP
jgi:hypothetical protein